MKEKSAWAIATFAAAGMLAAGAAGHAGILVPEENAREASVARSIPVYPIASLHQAVDFFRASAWFLPTLSLQFLFTLAA